MLAHPKPALTALASLDNVGGSAARCRLERSKQVARKKHRMSPEQLRLMSRRIDPTQPLPSPHTAPAKPALPVLYSPSPPTSKKRKRVGAHYTAKQAASSSEPVIYTPPTSPLLPPNNSSNKLFQTCFDIWPGAPSLGDLTHENVKCLSELLKVRLSQAKYRLMAALEADKTDPLYLQLKSGEDDQGWPLLTRKPPKIQLPTKRHHAFVVTVGSGRRLFKNMIPSPSSTTTITPTTTTITPKQHVKLVTDDSGKLSVVAVTTPAQERKRSSKKQKIAPLVGVSVSGRGVTRRQQGRTVFCCKPCNKRYKNRSGLAYHLDRCKYQPPPGKENIQCICGDVSQKDQTLVCCHTCQSWLHRSCLGLKDDADDKEYTCPRCPSPSPPALITEQQQQQQQQQQDLVTMDEDQQQLLWPTSMFEGYGSPWSMPDIPSILFSDPLNMTDEDYGLMTPTSNVSSLDTPLPQQDSCWFEFADFDNDFTCD